MRWRIGSGPNAEKSGETTAPSFSALSLSPETLRSLEQKGYTAPKGPKGSGPRGGGTHGGSPRKTG